MDSPHKVIMGIMSFKSGLLVFVLLIASTACRPPTPNPVMETAVPSNPVPASPEPEPTITRSATIVLAQTEIPAPTQTLEPSFLMCSPLALHPLEELPEIIGDPYNPPPPGREERHHGVDFGYYHWRERDTMLGEPVQSALPGVVASVLDDHYPYGNMVMVETPRLFLPPELVNRLQIPEGESLYLLYAHLSQSPLVRLGQSVDACQPLGEVGKSGNTDIPHLHLETRLGPAGTLFESMRFYDTHATQEEMDNYKLWRTSGVFRHFDPMDLFTVQMSP